LTLSSKGDTLLRLAGDSSVYFGLRQLSGEEVITRPFQDLYTFRMDFADTLEGGIESYINPTTQDGNPIPPDFVEDLALEVEYKDVNGWTRSVVMPVMLSVLGQYLTSSDSVSTVGLAQRGETIAFTGYLPEYSSLISTNVYVGKKARERLYETGGLNTINDSNLTAALDSDAIGLTGMSIYKGTCRLSNTEDGVDSSTNDTLKSYTTAFSFSESAPIYYFTTTDTAGRKIAADSKVSITMKGYDKKNPLIAAKPEWNILIRLRTSTPQTSGTTGDVSVRLDYYNTSNNDVSSQIYNARELCNEYLGYWPSANGATGSFAYAYGMKPGGYIEFPVVLNDVAALTSVYVALGANADDYQIDAISVCSMDDIGRRRIYKQSVTGEGDSSQFRIVRTNSHAEISPFPISFKTPQLYSQGDYQMYDLLSGRTGDVSSAKDTFTDNRYSMTYDQTKEDLGFVKTGKTYDVTVKVADDAESSNANGDSGSTNQFFFQLVFKNGNSAFVLANQQMTSDGFRAGYQENFTISVNRDYGVLRSIRIIPEDIDSKSEVFDKLNIEKITVTEKANGGAAMQYNFDNVGWIGIDYHDSAEASSIRGRSGRFLGEIATTYSVTSYQQVVSLLCEISTLPPQIEAEMCNQVSVACDFNYIDTNDQPQTISFDIVTRLAEYMNKTPITYEAPTDGSRASYYKNMGTVSDPEWMFRPNHTDRFIMPAIPDLKSVKSMELYGTNRSRDTAKWVIGGVSISEILSDGSLQLTSNDEYYRNLSTAPICRMVSLSG
ncbi:MAG: hypothetical protein J6N76_08510, partial [Lachnospiraceae bacterium]|nr:hypothetical protein [Lachnospiraceae bacterium]